MTDDVARTREELEQAIKDYQRCPFYHWWKDSFTDLMAVRPDDNREIEKLRAQLRDYYDWPLAAIFDRFET